MRYPNAGSGKSQYAEKYIRGNHGYTLLGVNAALDQMRVRNLTQSSVQSLLLLRQRCGTEIQACHDDTQFRAENISSLAFES